jgi:uncharacterized membrane protein SpoIIM required for sporulation
MKETNFINQNKKKWSQGERLFKEDSNNPEVLSDAYVEVSEDLSFSRTFYPHRGIRIYLNRFAQALYFKIDKRKLSVSGVKRFWKEEIPFAMHESRKDMRLALFIFLTGILIGITSNIYDPEFSRQILGDSYVNMTLENIEKGDPVAVYKGAESMDMFFAITVNNLMVAYRTFIMGIAFSVGSGLILFYNAVMVGSFQTFFFQNEVGFESMLGIWLHGTLEISAIVLAGGAGLTLGRGLLFPGTFTRFEAFQMSAQRGIKVMLGITPVFIIAGFIESFATRFTDAPTILRLTIIFASLFFIIGYYVWIPWQKGKVGFPKGFYRFKIPPSGTSKIQLDKIKDVGELISASIKLLKNTGALPISSVIVSSLLFTLFFMYSNWETDLMTTINSSSIVANIYRYFTYYKVDIGFVLNWALFTSVFASVLHSVRKFLAPHAKFTWSHWLFLGGVVLVWNFIYLLPEEHSWWVSLLASPFLFLVIAGKFNLTERPLEMSQVISVSFTQYYKSIGLLFAMSILAFVTMFILYSPMLWMYVEIIQMNITMEDDTLIHLITFIVTFVLSFVYFFVYQAILMGMIMAFYSNMEAKYAWGLRDDIDRITAKKFAYGLEREVE